MTENSSNAATLDQRRSGRRRFIGGSAFAGLGVLGASQILHPRLPLARSDEMEMPALTDVDILNFALNLEYLEAEFYLRALRGRGLNDHDITGPEGPGDVMGGAEVPFESDAVHQYAREITLDEVRHVRFLRAALGEAAVARPPIDLQASFTAAAQAAGLIGSGEMFDPFADENSFLLGAFLFEDVGVTAYKGAARFLENKDFLEAAAGILAVEAYHASNVRTVLFGRGLIEPAGAISDARDSLDGEDDLDQGIVDDQGRANIVPADDNAIAFSRTPEQVLNIVYLNRETMPGGFFPHGLNGTIR
jgi:Ferritin-like domain